MTNKKKILIETLHGSVAQLNELSSMTEGVDIYDNTGHVDTDFLIEAISCVSAFMDASNIVVEKISSLLAPDVPIAEKEKQADEGKKWSVEEILKHCTLEDGVLKLPQVQFNKKSYAEAKKWIEEAGGSWQGGKIQGFTFPFNPKRVFSVLKEGKRCNLQQDYQFFETPSDVADWLVMLAGGIHEDDTVLEPSAGRGALIKAIHRACPSVTVECYELMPENREFLHTLSNVILLDEDFTKDSVGSYTKIIANPPFSGNQDIEHVRLMYDRLEEVLIRSRMKNKLRTCFFKYSLHTRTVSNICNQYTDLQILPMIRQFQLYIIQWGFCLIYQNQLIRIQCSQLANDFPSYSSRRSRNHYSTPLDMGRNFTHVNLHRFSTEPIFYLNVLYQSIVHTIA